MKINDLVEKYQKNRNNYISTKYNETLLRSDFLDPLFELLGWDIKNAEGKPTNEREVILEEPLKESSVSTSKKPDYTFRLYSERKFFLEAKKPSVNLLNNDETAKQVRRYGFTAKLKISILSNFEHLLIYDCSQKVEKTDSFNKCLIKTYHYSEYIEKFEELKQLFGHEAVYSGEFDKVWENIEEQLKLFSVDNLFLSHINSWRIALGSEIYKYSPKISEQLLNDYVQSYLNRIIFLRVCEDRNLEDYQTLLNFANEQNFKALIQKFEQADKKYNSGLFEQFLSNELISNISSVFWTIIKELYYPESPYSFSVFASDILGNIYEIFLAEKLSIQNNEIVLVKKPENIDKDIITTPTYIINDILNQTVIPFCKQKTDKQILKTKLSDIACGSGAFLLQSFQLLNDVLIDYYLQNDKSKLIQTAIDTFKLNFDTKRKILTNCIFGIDKDFNAVEAAKFGLLLKLLETENNFTTSDFKPVLPDLSKNILFGNSLISSVEKKYSEIVNPYNFGETKFDIIVGNPPYMKSEDMKQFTPIEHNLYKNIYKTAYKQYDKYFLFIERSLELLKENGYLGFIVPSKFTKVGAAKKLRNLLSNSQYIKQLISFGANQIFQSKTTYTCFLIAQKKQNPYLEYFEIKDLTNWQIRKYDETEFDKISHTALDEDVWILVPTYLKATYNKIISQSVELGDLIGEENIFNGIQTSANNIYILKPNKEDDNFVYFTKNKKDYKIEKSFLKPYFETTTGNDNLYTYRPFKPNRYVLYPYLRTEEGLGFIEISDLQTQYPFAYQYLIENKAKLADPKRDIKPEPLTENEWYRYGRHQSLEKCDVPAKIIVGVLSVGNKYAIDYYGTLISSGGTAGYCMIALPANFKYSIYYIQALLNSKYLEWFSALIGEVFRGGYIARGTKVLKKLPIRIIDFKNKSDKELHDKISKTQQELIQLQSEIDNSSTDKRKLTVLNREFSNNLTNLNELLKQLYNIENDTIIPSIKDLYATN